MDDQARILVVVVVAMLVFALAARAEAAGFRHDRGEAATIYWPKVALHPERMERTTAPRWLLESMYTRHWSAQRCRRPCGFDSVG